MGVLRMAALQEGQVDAWRSAAEAVRREVAIEWAETQFRKQGNELCRLTILLRHGDLRSRIEFRENLDRPEEEIVEALRLEMSAAMEDFQRAIAKCSGEPE